MLSSRPLIIPTNFDEGAVHVGSTKTPAKSLHKTPGRTIAKNRIALQENAAYYGGTMTVNRKGKAVMQTPLRGISPRKGIQTAIKPTILVSRPLGDKTPFPNRLQNVAPLHTPAPKASKVAKLSLFDQDLQELAKTPGHLLLPSSTRKSLRAPRQSGGQVKCSDFKTPMTNGNHWDVSDGDIQVAVNHAELEAENEYDYDEIEYMPPKQPELPYEPLFPMPNYKILGQNLLSLASSTYIDDMAELQFSRPVEEDIDCDQILNSTNPLEWIQAHLAEPDDDIPFQLLIPELTARHPPTKPLTRSQNAAASKAPTARSTQIGSTRSGAIRPSSATISRPPSSTNTRPSSAGSSRVPSRSVNLNLKSVQGPTVVKSSIPSPNPSVPKEKPPAATRTTRAPVTTRLTSAGAATRSRSVTLPKHSGKVDLMSKAENNLFSVKNEVIVEDDFLFEL